MACSGAHHPDLLADRLWFEPVNSYIVMRYPLFFRGKLHIITVYRMKIGIPARRRREGFAAEFRFGSGLEVTFPRSLPGADTPDNVGAVMLTLKSIFPRMPVDVSGEPVSAVQPERSVHGDFQQQV